MKLFYSRDACSLAPIIVAEWLDIKLTLQKVDLENPGDYFLSNNPLGSVPVLEMNGGECKNQVDAILQYFCALNPEGKLAGNDIFEWFEIDRWIAFLTGDFHPAFNAWFNPRRFTTAQDDESIEAVRAAAVNRIHRVAEVLEKQIGTSNHVALDRRTLLDPYAFSMLRWMGYLEGRFDRYPNTRRFLDHMEKDLDVQKALMKESA